MMLCLKDSLVYRTYAHLLEWYRQSITARAASTLGRWYEASCLHNKLVNYVNKDSAAEHTMTYRILAFIGGKLDFAAGKLNAFIIKYGERSKCYQLYKVIKAEAVNNAALLIFATVLPFIAGYSLITTLRGLWSFNKLLVMLLLLAASFLLAIFVRKWNDWGRNSSLYRFLKYIWE